MRSGIVVTAALFALASRAGLAQPAALTGTNVTARSVAPGDLGGAIRRLGSGAAPVWAAWTSPLEDPERWMCCFDGSGRGEARGDCGRCSLERDASFEMDREGASRSLEGPRDFVILARLAGGRVEKLRHFSLGCRIEAGAAAVVFLEGVPAAESVAWLEAVAARETGSRASRSEEDDDEADRVAGPAIASIALTAGAEAEAALDRLMAKSRPLALRKKTAFWLAAGRGRSGCRRLEAVLPSDGAEAFRKHGTFVLSLCKDEAATAALLGLARRDASPEVRGQALFWLAQKAGRAVSAAIEEAIREDPETEVKKQAVFALTQMPDGEGVPELIRVARTNRNPEVRERAVFWLGQSGDPRALDFIEEVLTSR